MNPPVERSLLPPLIAWLRFQKRLRAGTLVVAELAWLGRRIDLATLSKSGVASSFELKINHMRRALEQATYNQLAFARSYIAVASMPSQPNLELAKHSGIGVILIRNGDARLLVECAQSDPEPVLASRLRSAISASGGAKLDV